MILTEIDRDNTSFLSRLLVFCRKNAKVKTSGEIKTMQNFAIILKKSAVWHKLNWGYLFGSKIMKSFKCIKIDCAFVSARVVFVHCGI